MSDDNTYEQPQLEIVAEVDSDKSDHAKLMRAYRRLNQKIDFLIKSKKNVSADAARKP